MHTDSSVAPPRMWLRNVGSGYADALIGGTAFLAITPVIIQQLGTEAYALWIFSHVITFYLQFLDLGFTQAQVRFHAHFAARNRPATLARLIRRTFKSLCIAGCIAAALGAGIALLAPLDWMEVAAARQDEFRLVLLILALNLFIALPGSALECVYEGAQRFDLRNLRSMILRALTLGLQFTALAYGYGLVALACIELGASALRLLIDSVLIRRLVPELFHKSQQVLSERVWRRIRPFARWALIDDLLVEGSLQLNKLVMALVLPVRTLAPYSLCGTAAGVLLTAIAPFTETLYPMAAGLHAERRTAQLRKLLLTATRMAMSIAIPLALLLALFGTEALILWVPQMQGAVPSALMPLMVTDALVSVFLCSSTLMLMAMGHMRAVVVLTMAEIMLSIILILVLAPIYGVVGFAAATLVSNVALGIGVQCRLVCQVLDMPLARLWAGTVRILWTALPALVAAVGLYSIVRPSSWFGFGAVAAIVGTVHLCGFAFIGLDDAQRQYIARRLASRWRKVGSARSPSAPQERIP